MALDHAPAAPTQDDAPPHDMQIEQGLLGAFLFDNRLFHRVAGQIEMESFFDPVHMVIFEAMRRELVAGRRVDAISLAPMLAHVPELNDGLTVKVYLGRLVSCAAPSVSVPDYAAALVRLAARRALLVTAETLAAQARHPAADIAETALDAVRELDTALAKQRTKATCFDYYRTTSDLIDDCVNPDPTRQIKIGLADLDNYFGGWHRGTLNLLAGRPSMGKSTVGVSLLLRAAKDGTPGALFSLEMSRKECAARMNSDMAWSPDNPIVYERLLKGTATDAEIKRVVMIATEHRELPLMIDDQAGLTLAEITARARRLNDEMKRRHGKALGLVMIDHLGLIKPSNRYAGNKVNETGEISSGLKQLAKDLDVAVIALAQLNRAADQRDNKRPTLADLRNSGDLEQDADVVAFCFREVYYLERTRYTDPVEESARLAAIEQCKNVLELLISKNRNGRVGAIPLFCDIGGNAIRLATRDGTPILDRQPDVEFVNPERTPDAASTRV